jgi:hypothetical protein
MAPLDEALYHYVMDCRKLHTDDTPVPCWRRAEEDENRAYLDICP